MHNLSLDMAEKICQISQQRQCRFVGKKEGFYFCAKDNPTLKKLIELEVQEIESKYGKDKKWILSDNCSGYKAMTSAVRS